MECYLFETSSCGLHTIAFLAYLIYDHLSILQSVFEKYIVKTHF